MFKILPQLPSEVVARPEKPALSQKWQWLTIVLAQDKGVNASESKHIQEVPGSRAHPDKSEQAQLISVQSWRVISFQKHTQTTQGFSNTFNIFQVSIRPCLLRTQAYQDASKVSSSIPCCNIGLKRSVRGNGTFAAGLKKKAQFHKVTLCNCDCEGECLFVKEK